MDWPACSRIPDALTSNRGLSLGGSVRQEDRATLMRPGNSIAIVYEEGGHGGGVISTARAAANRRGATG